MTAFIGRREFNRLLGGAAAAWPLAARGQQGERVRRVGVLMGVGENDPEGQARVAAFQQGLAELNWADGRNVHIDYRWAAGETDRIRAYTAELVALAPDVLIGNGTSALRALRDATQSIPIVFVLVNDPVGQGFIANLARPGGNITGFSFLEYSMIGKSLELLRQLAPNVNRLAIMFNPTTAPHYNVFLRSLETVPPPTPLEIKAAPVGTQAEIEQAVAKLAKEPGGGLLVPPDTYMVVHRGLVISSAAQHRLPAIFTYRQFAREGALITYGPETTAIFHRAASYVDRILRGANPGDLPAPSRTASSGLRPPPCYGDLWSRPACVLAVVLQLDRRRAALLGLYVFGTLGINLCYHRLLTHRGFVCPKWLEHSLADPRRVLPAGHAGALGRDPSHPPPALRRAARPAQPAGQFSVGPHGLACCSRTATSAAADL